jgi:hypothetical protein
MRCTDAVLSAFLSHPVYKSRQEFIEAGIELAQKNWAFAYYLPQDSANYALNDYLKRIVKKQRPTGLWEKKYGEKKAYAILRSLKHARMLPDLIVSGVLKYDPYKPFSESKDLYGFLVRKNIMESILTDDPDLQRQLISEITNVQDKNGSWNNTVVTTSFRIERLLELGFEPDALAIMKGAEWILSQFRETIERRRPRATWSVFMNNVFTNEDCGAEFHSALEDIPEGIPRNSCFSALPLIQTALALRVLVRLGFEDDERVAKSYQSLLDINVPPKHNPRLPGWCAHQCRFLLEDRVKVERKRKR